MSQRIKNDLHPFSPDEFECWNEVRIARHYNNGPYGLSEGQTRHIKANSHIDPFLIEIEVEIAIGQWAGRFDEGFCLSAA